MAKNDLDAPKAKQDMPPAGEPEKKGFWPKFSNFLAAGGFLVILVAGVAIVLELHSL